MEDNSVMKVLQMLQDGKLTPEQAATLISALKGEPDPQPTPPPAPEPPAADKPLFDDIKDKVKSQKIEFDFDHLGDRISRAVSRVQPEKIVARVQAQLRNASKASAAWSANFSAKVKTWTDGSDSRPSNVGGLSVLSESSEQEFYLQPGASILVENPLGDVRISSHEGQTAVLIVKKEVWGEEPHLPALMQTISLNVFATDGRLDVKAAAPEGFREGVLDIELVAPANAVIRASTRFGDVSITDFESRVEAATTSGDISIENVGGDVRCETASGDISLRSIQGSAVAATESGDIDAASIKRGLSANSSSGDVNATDVEGGKVECKSVSGDVQVNGIGAVAPVDIVVESVSGDVSLTGASGNIALKAVSGDIQADELVANRVQAQTVSGNVELKVHSQFSGTMQVSTVSGDVTLGLPLDTNARVSMSTTSGDLRCDHDASSVIAAETLWQGQIGTGAGTVNIQTISGNSHVAQLG